MKYLPVVVLLGTTPFLVSGETPTAKPPIDRAQPAKIETATFAMG